MTCIFTIKGSRGCTARAQARLDLRFLERSQRHPARHGRATTRDMMRRWEVETLARVLGRYPYATAIHRRAMKRINTREQATVCSAM